ncbi:Cytochrome P450 monooxygenase [Lachnellula occidentalis]|uniref:Cytochrome P450 monooxygenase n=1 Tax=Lachnellula occidentalis TaxID=215460 RepID=A0A8H8UKP6_9HELO|nr:Cytochrome P450 monooxygenase [Lachnellula occidentalis]
MQAMEGDVVLIPPKYLDELKSMPDSHFDFAQGQEISLMSKYTKTPITELVTTAMRNNVGPQAEWKSVTVFPKVPLLVATTGGILLSGEELNSNEEWAKICIDYLNNVFQGGGKLTVCPTFLQPLAQFFIPELYRIKTCMKKANEIAIPVIEKRLKNMEREDFQKPNDLIQWALDLSIQKGPVNLQEQVECQLMGALGAVHTTSLTFTQAIYGMKPPVREPHAR